MLTAAAAGILPLADLSVDEQLARRQARVEEALRRGRIRADILPIVPSPLQVGARARVKLRAGPDGRLGFHRPGSHDWVEVDLAEIARPEVVAEAAHLAGRVRGEVEIRSDGKKVAVVVERAGELDGNVFSVEGPLGDEGRVQRRRGRVVCGDPRLDVGGLRVSALSFYQVNLEINARIVADVDALLRELAPTRLLDLYAGIGNLSARAAGRGVPSTLVELDESSAGDARVNAPGAEIVRGDAGKLAAGRHFFDVLLLDPPRAGAPGLLQRLTLTRPRAIVYLSCEPAHLARDIAPMLAQGYRLERVQPYDMFPGTEHVETLAVLTR